MRTTNQFLILTVITAIFTVPALAKVEPRLPDEPIPILIGQAFPQLAGIEALYFYIVMPEAEAKIHSVAWKELKRNVEIKLDLAGIILIPQTDKGRQIKSPVIRVDIDMLKPKDTQQYIFHIQTSLARAVYLATQPKLGFQADVWKAKAAMQAVSVQNMPAVVTGVVIEQIDVFIAAWFAANPPGRKTADVNDIAAVLPVVTPRQTTPAIKPTTVKYKYVASKNSKVFHKSDCRWVKRIKPTNLVTFSTRNDAIQAGKRPCKQCKP
jgi:hypothetical protein